MISQYQLSCMHGDWYKTDTAAVVSWVALIAAPSCSKTCKTTVHPNPNLVVGSRSAGRAIPPRVLVTLSEEKLEISPKDPKTRLNPFTTGNPFLRTKLHGFSIGRGSGALKVLINQAEILQEVFCRIVLHAGPFYSSSMMPSWQ